jgi:hypothetical protein
MLSGANVYASNQPVGNVPQQQLTPTGFQHTQRSASIGGAANVDLPPMIINQARMSMQMNNLGGATSVAGLAPSGLTNASLLSVNQMSSNNLLSYTGTGAATHGAGSGSLNSARCSLRSASGGDAYSLFNTQAYAGTCQF